MWSFLWCFRGGSGTVVPCGGGRIGWLGCRDGSCRAEEAAAGVEGDGDVSGDGDVGVAYLPVAPPEMRDGSFAV